MTLPWGIHGNSSISSPLKDLGPSCRTLPRRSSPWRRSGLWTVLTCSRRPLLPVWWLPWRTPIIWGYLLWIKKSSHRFALRQGLAQGIDIYCILSGQPTTVQLNENSCWFHFFQHGYDKHFFWGWVDPTSCSCRMPLQFLPSLRLLQMMVQDEVNQVLGVLLGWHS